MKRESFGTDVCDLFLISYIFTSCFHSIFENIDQIALIHLQDSHFDFQH